MKNELDDLIQQKREIERKIKELRNCAPIVGQAKIDVEHYPTTKPDRHFLAIYYKPLDSGRSKWQTIFSANDRDSVINKIPEIIENLQELYNRNTRGD